MSKPIINGIDVSECCFYNNGKCNNPNGMACNCINNAVCYFKELKRLEQERDELQDKYSKMIHKYNDLYEKYRAKEILEPDLKNEIKKFDALSIKYGQALEEIRDIVSDEIDKTDADDELMQIYGTIYNRCNEVLK